MFIILFLIQMCPSVRLAASFSAGITIILAVITTGKILTSLRRIIDWGTSTNVQLNQNWNNIPHIIDRRKLSSWCSTKVRTSGPGTYLQTKGRNELWVSSKASKKTGILLVMFLAIPLKSFKQVIIAALYVCDTLYRAWEKEKGYSRSSECTFTAKTTTAASAGKCSTTKESWPTEKYFGERSYIWWRYSLRKIQSRNNVHRPHHLYQPSIKKNLLVWWVYFRNITRLWMKKRNGKFPRCMVARVNSSLMSCCPKPSTR